MNKPWRKHGAIRDVFNDNYGAIATRVNSDKKGNTFQLTALPGGSPLSLKSFAVIASRSAFAGSDGWITKDAMVAAANYARSVLGVAGLMDAAREFRVRNNLNNTDTVATGHDGNEGLHRVFATLSSADEARFVAAVAAAEAAAAAAAAGGASGGA